MEVMARVAVDTFMWCDSKGTDLKAKAQLQEGLDQLKRRLEK
jgi:hypothetical protein